MVHDTSSRRLCHCGGRAEFRVLTRELLGSPMPPGFFCQDCGRRVEEDIEQSCAGDGRQPRAEA